MVVAELISVFWFFLPAGIANMGPVFVKGVRLLDYPIDLGFKLGNKPLFGRNKTYRGLLFGIVLAMLTVLLQRFLADSMSSYSLIDYSVANPVILGFLLGFGALLGDLVESFFKRRFNISPG